MPERALLSEHIESCSVVLTCSCDVVFVLSATVTLDDNRTLRSYGVPPTAELRLRINEIGRADLFDQIDAKGRVEQGFKGTALSAAIGSPVVSSAPAAAAAAPAAASPSSSTPAASSASPRTSPASSGSDIPASVVLPPPATDPASVQPAAADRDTEMKDDESIQLTASSPALQPRDDATPMEVDEAPLAAAAPAPSGPSTPSPRSTASFTSDQYRKNDLALAIPVLDGDEEEASPVLPLAQRSGEKTKQESKEAGRRKSTAKHRKAQAIKQEAKSPTSNSSAE